MAADSKPTIDVNAPMRENQKSLLKGIGYLFLAAICLWLFFTTRISIAEAWGGLVLMVLSQISSSLTKIAKSMELIGKASEGR